MANHSTWKIRYFANTANFLVLDVHLHCKQHPHEGIMCINAWIHWLLRRWNLFWKGETGGATAQPFRPSLFRITNFYHYELMLSLKNFCASHWLGPRISASNPAPHKCFQSGPAQVLPIGPRMSASNRAPHKCFQSGPAWVLPIGPRTSTSNPAPHKCFQSGPAWVLSIRPRTCWGRHCLYV